jgi:hypothetical protein
MPIGVFVHLTLHCCGVPVMMSVVQALPSSHDVLQGLVLLVGSQVSEPVTRPSPQLVEQSVSVNGVQLGAQQPSPSLHALTVVSSQ